VVGGAVQDVVIGRLILREAGKDCHVGKKRLLARMKALVN
jgi:hypothetical protein